MTYIYVIGIAPQSEKYLYCPFEQFQQWALQQNEYQLDIETDVTDYWCNKKLITIQFGQVVKAGWHRKEAYVLQWSYLTEDQKTWVRWYVNQKQRKKLIQNAAFEYIVLRFHGMLIDNVYDTMLAEKVINGGEEMDDNTLGAIAYKYCNIWLDKTYQTAFGDDILTEGKIIYAASDVIYLDCIRRLQLLTIYEWNLENVLALENDAVLPLSEVTYRGMTLDKAKWIANIELAQPLVDASKKRLDGWLQRNEKFKEHAIKAGLYSDKVQIRINKNAPAQRLELLQLLFPLLPGANKPVLKKFIVTYGRDLSVEDLNILTAAHAGDFQPMIDRLLRDHESYLINKGYVLPAGICEVNWNSQTQVLPFAQILFPRLKSLAKDVLDKVTHEFFDDRTEYVDNLKLLSSFGQAFIDQYVEPDGKVRTSINQIVSTGRISTSKPNMQNIPVKEPPDDVLKIWMEKRPTWKASEFITRYRNSFGYDPGWWFVDSDMASQELAIIAYISKDPVWAEAITKKQDLHSVAGELVFKDKWKKGTVPGCAYYKEIFVNGKREYSKQKCKCPVHKKLRTGVKTINFGLAYGMSKFKLSGTMRSTVKEAEMLIDEYFKAFPSIGRVLNYLGNFGVRNGYIQTLHPFYRKRWFKPDWELNKNYIEYHIRGIQYNPALGEIERQSKNQPIQGSSADQIKLAMVMIYWYKQENTYDGILVDDIVHLVAQVHDQVTTTAVSKEVAEWWAPILDRIMCESAKVIVHTGILIAETAISPYWTK